MIDLFLERREKWLKEVAEGCHEMATEIEGSPDFYVFQSRSDIHNPDLLIIGANPGNYQSYEERISILKKERNVDRRDWENLGYESNQYIENERNPQWKINKPILKMFTEPGARRALEKSVIMNVVYFNTRNVKDLNNFPNGREMIDFCINKTKKFIYKICRPKVVLILGLDAAKWLGVNFERNNDTVLESEDKLFLIQAKQIDKINHMLIYHPSMNQKFNSGVNLEKKRDFFNQYFV